MNKQKNRFLIQMSAAGNSFLIADRRWFEREIMDFLSPYSFSIEKSFEDFIQLSEKTFEERQIFFQEVTSSELISHTDGFIILKDFTNSIPHYDFYNKDGSIPEMCGNASCCLVHYGQKTGLHFQSFQFQEELVKAFKNFQGDWAVSFKSNPTLKDDLSFFFKGKHYPYLFLESGVPHAVLEWGSVFKKENLKPLAKELRFKNPFNKSGMNVSFYQVERENHLKAITFERGVEDFTSACGTGALSVAFAFVHQYPDNNFKEVFVHMPGGELVIELKTPALLKSPVKWGY